MSKERKSYKKHAEEAEQRMMHYNSILESARELKLSWLKVFAEDKIEEEIDRAKRFRIAQGWDKKLEDEKNREKYTPEILSKMQEAFMQKHNLKELKKYVCLKDFKKAKRGDELKQSFNIEGDILYFGENEDYGSWWLYPSEVENNPAFAEIGTE